MGRRCGNCALVTYRIKLFCKAHQAQHPRYELDMRLGNKNKADQFISVLPVLWSCASHMAYLSREGRRTSDFFIFERKSPISIN